MADSVFLGRENFRIGKSIFSEFFSAPAEDGRSLKFKISSEAGAGEQRL